MSPPTLPVDIEHPSTWIKFRKKLCIDCFGSCCTLPVEVKIEDLVRMKVVDPFEVREPHKKIAKRLQKAGIIDHFHFKNDIFTLARMANDDCIYMDSGSRRCTIYDKRPQTCRNHPRIGPRPGFCAYRPSKK